MRFIQKPTLFILLLSLSACATLPTGPGVNVLPAQGKSFETFRAEDATCRNWAEQQIGAPVQQTYDNSTATGAVAGTAVGAGLGAALGSVSGHAGAGALIGAASGLLVGTAAGSDSGRVYGREAQRRYDNSYVQCMYSYGNQVPEYRTRVAVAPPPPPSANVPPPPPPEVSPDPGQYSPPPEVYIDATPQFIYSPELNMYVAVGVPYDLIYTGVEYFYFHAGRWYRGPYYNGPWVFAVRRHFPQPLIRYRVDQIRHYRDVEYRRYEHDRAHYNGRFHRPEFRGERRK